MLYHFFLRKKKKKLVNYEARVRFQVQVRYGGTTIFKKLGYGYGGVYFIFNIFIYCYILYILILLN
jgi:hypothetical protein